MRPRHDETAFSAELLRRGLVLGEGFGIHVVSAEQLETREALVRSLSEDPALAVAVVDVAGRGDAAIDGPIEDAQRSIAPSDRRTVLVVTGLEPLAERVPELMARINEHRNELRARIDGALVLLGTPVLLDLVQRRAPDVWSARAADVELEEAPPSWQPPPLRPWAGSGATAEVLQWQRELRTMPRGERRGRLAARIAEHLERDGARGARVRALYGVAATELEDPAWKALALIHAAGLDEPSSRGNADEAMATAEAAVRELDHEASPPWLAARAWTALAHAWQARGRLDEAWEATHRALELGEDSSPDVHADMLAGYAELLARTGRLSEALATWEGVLSLPQSAISHLGSLVRAGTTAALAGRGDRLDRYWRRYLALGGRPRQLDAEIDALGGATAALARERLAAMR